MEPIRVLHVLGRLGSGGVEKLLVSLFENMNRDEIIFDFLLSNGEKGFYDKYVQDMGAKLICIPSGTTFSEKLHRRIESFQFFKQCEYSIIHFHGTQPATYFDACLAKCAGVKNVILHAHNTKSLTKNRTLILPAFKMLFGKYPTFYIACSQEAADYMWPKNVDPDKCSVVINGIDFSKYEFSKTKRDKFREENNLVDKFVVGHIGRFAEQKNHGFLFRVFKEVLHTIPNSVLLLVGEGPIEAEVRSMAASVGIEGRTIFFGTTKDVPSALMGMDVMCFPSHYEGLGIVAVEAQAASLPIVVSEGVPESANISSFYYKLNLKDPIEKWATAICSFSCGGVQELPSIPTLVHNTTSNKRLAG